MKKTMIAMLMVSGLAAVTHAGDGKFEVGAGISDIIPVSSDFKDAAKSSLGVTAYGDYKINEIFTGGLEAGYAFGHESKASSSVDYRCTTIGLRGRYVKALDFGPKKGHVYGILGVASYIWSTDPESSLDTTKIGFNFGGGADLELFPNWLAGVELRYHLVKMGGIDGNSLAPTLKVGYTF